MDADVKAAVTLFGVDTVTANLTTLVCIQSVLWVRAQCLTPLANIPD